jgi:hypothetical protein
VPSTLLRIWYVRLQAMSSSATTACVWSLPYSTPLSGPKGAIPFPGENRSNPWTSSPSLIDPAGLQS